MSARELTREQIASIRYTLTGDGEGGYQAEDINALCDMALASLEPVALQEPVAWQPIETAQKSGRTLLLGYYNSLGNWRTMRGQWFSNDQIEEEWENQDCGEGWYETSVENEDIPNCWPTEPTHWQPLPAPPALGESKPLGLAE